MKKFVASAIALHFFAFSNADDVKILTLGLGCPGLEEPGLMGLGMSPDGRYVCGSMDQGKGVFVADLAMQVSSSDFCDDSELRAVDMSGMAIGFMGDMGVTFSWNGDATAMDDFKGEYKYVIGEDLTHDGLTKVGSLTAVGYVTSAAISRNGGEWTLLPLPPTEELGQFTHQSSAKKISGDGKYIIGHAGSFGPLILWTRNDDGGYDPEAVFNRFCPRTIEEEKEGLKPLVAMSPRDISDNGLYVLCAGARYGKDGELVKFPVVYNTETHDITMYDEIQHIDPEGIGLTGHAIADDGTFVGIIGDVSYYGCMGCFVMKAGKKQAELFVEAYPNYSELFAHSDDAGMSVPTAMSADGRFILGHVYYSENYFDDSSAFFLTYIIRTGEGDSGVEAVPEDRADSIFSLEGVRLPEMRKGINIVRKADGSVRKVMVK